MKKRPKASEGGANWMDTYGDMVTLLLCFFVLLNGIIQPCHCLTKCLKNGFSVIPQHGAVPVKEYHILGHTSQVAPGIPNEAHTDRLLSAERSAEVVAYLQQVSDIDPAKMISSGFGQFRPIGDFATPEGRAKNRRVEILITRTGAVEQNLDTYYNQVYGQ